MFGDRPNTDIQMANNAGIDSVLVLSGVTQNEKDVHDWVGQDKLNAPTYVMDMFGEDIKMNEQELAKI